MSQTPTPEEERVQSQVFDWEALKDYFGYVKNALLRHKLLALGTFVVTAALGLALAKFLPRTFYSETTLLPKRASIIAALVNPNRIPALDADPPNPLRPPGEVDSVSRSAAQAIMRRENLVAIVKRVNLMDRWDATRAPLLRLKDTVMHLVSARPAEDIKLDAMVGMLEKALVVSTDDGKVTISVTWPDPQLAQDLVASAQESFIEARKSDDLESARDALDILQGQRDETYEEYKNALKDLESAFNTVMAERRRLVGNLNLRGGDRQQQLAAAAFRVVTNRNAIMDAEEKFNRDLALQEKQVVEQRRVLGEDNPTWVEQKQRVEALKARGVPRSDDLWARDTELTQEYRRLGGTDILPYPGQPVPDQFGLERVLVAILPAMSENPSVSSAVDALRNRTLKLQQWGERIEAAKIEQKIMMKSFRYRYTVLSPPDFPRAPVKPNAKVIAIGGILAGLLLGVFAAIARDVLSGRFLQSWQVKRGLGLPVLAEMEAAPLESQSR